MRSIRSSVGVQPALIYSFLLTLLALDASYRSRVDIHRRGGPVGREEEMAEKVPVRQYSQDVVIHVYQN